ncbi:MAG: zinc ribbon domain-containing protein, partial [Coprothermobacterota bacterium]|nr:zinc ribbon domain-containing protein [Coprothermobacterota bacterium]
EPLGYSLNLAPGTDARTVEFLPYDGEEWQPVPESGFALRAGDRLRTKDPNKIVSIKLTAGESTLCGTRIARGTISFGKVVDNQKYKTTKILLESNPGGIGGILAPAGLAIDILTNDVANPPRVEVRTQNAVITVLGTAAVIEEIENETSVKVLEGAVQTIAYGNGASQVLAAGQAITGNEQGFSAIASFDMAAELAKWGPLEGIVASPSASIQPSSEVPTGISPTATALPTPQPTSSGIFLGLSTQWWIVIGAGLGLLLLAILVLVLILRSGRRQRRVPFAYSVPPIPGPVAIHCRACGTALPGGQRFCGSCGADSLMTVASPVAPMIVPLIVPAGNVCPVCSRLMNPGDRFCQGCGSALPGGPT